LEDLGHVNAHFYRKTKQAMGARRGKRRGRGKPKKTWEDCEIDVVRRRGNTLTGIKRLARDRIVFRQWTEDPTLQGTGDR
jgi:hypothetical protein